MRRGLLVVLVACHGATPAAPAREPYRLAEPPVLPAWSPVCTTSPAPQQKVIFDFGETPIYPVWVGPRASERSHAGVPRSIPQLEHALQRAAKPITDCWQWASYRGAPATRLDLTLAVEPSGKSHVRALVNHPGAPVTSELIGCVREVADGLELAPSPRATTFRAELAFERVDLPFGFVPSRPKPRTVEPRACGPVARVPEDVVTAHRPFVVTNDGSVVANTRVGCSDMRTSPHKVDIRTALLGNRGALQRCYAAAHLRTGIAGGTIALAFEVVAGGLPQNVVVTGAGDAAFHSCIAAAAREMWVTPEFDNSRFAEAHIPLVLATVTPDLDASALGDGEAAVGSAVEAVRRAGDPVAACAARARVVKALAAKLPWLDDPRALGAITELGAFAGTLPHDAAATCLAGIEDVATELVRPIVRTQIPRAELLPRIDAALAIAPYFSWRDELRRAHAEALLEGPRHEAGIAELVALARDAPKLRDDLRARVAALREPAIRLTGCW